MMNWWPFKTDKSDILPFVEEFVDKAKVKIPTFRDITQLDFVILDTETTGLNPKTDFILSFGAVKISKQILRVSSAVEWYPQSPSEGQATAPIHGLVHRKEQLKPKEFAQHLLKFIDSSIIVGHHIGFDIEMLLKILKSYGLNRFPNPILDTVNFAIRLDYGPLADHNLLNKENYSLDKLCEKYDIPVVDRHTAAGDAFLTAQLLQKLLKVAEHKGITNFGNLIR